MAIAESSTQPEINLKNALPLKYRNYTIRLAQTNEEIALAQALRYEVFYRENGAIPNSTQKQLKRDVSKFDEHCDHLIAIDEQQNNNDGSKGRIVATYRLMQRSGAKLTNGFLTAEEYDLTQITKQKCQILELSRACIEQSYRKTPVMQLLWQALSIYVLSNKIRYMFGCASFHGTNIEPLKESLAYLYHQHLAPKKIRAYALPELYQNMQLVPPENISNDKAFRQLPALLRGYLRLGGWVGDGAVIDPIIQTIDVCIIVDTDNVAKRYYQHYTRSINP